MSGRGGYFSGVDEIADLKRRVQKLESLLSGLTKQKVTTKVWGFKKQMHVETLARLVIPHTPYPEKKLRFLECDNTLIYEFIIQDEVNEAQDIIVPACGTSSSGSGSSSTSFVLMDDPDFQQIRAIALCGL